MKNNIYYRFPNIQSVDQTSKNIGLANIAICHEWIDNKGGGERVLKNLLDLYPNATIFTLWSDKEISNQISAKIRVSFLNYFPVFLRRTVAVFLMPLAWRLFDKELSAYEIVITSSWAFAHLAGSKNKIKIDYVHTPGRYWWYPEIDKRSQRFYLGPLLKILRKMDSRPSKKNVVVIANSQTTQIRIKECWDIESLIIYPPVETDFFQLSRKKIQIEPYLLSVGRFIPYKNHEFVIELGEILGMKVIVAGHGPLYEEYMKLKKLKKIDVEIINNPTDQELLELYQNATCLIFPTEEDFGIVPVEAMSCGIPVLGISKGGLVETVLPNVSGTLVPELNLKSFEDAFNSMKVASPAEIRRSVDKFNKERFQLEIVRIINNRKFD